MTNYAFFANSATLSLMIGATSCPVAALKNVSFTPRYEISELYGMESTHIRARAKYALKVDVACEFAMWDTDQDYVMRSFLNGGYSSTNPATDNDTACTRSKVALFTVSASVGDSTCSRVMWATAYNVAFPEVPFELRENEWITRGLRGVGESISYATVVYS